ncbi:MAG: phosphatase PAP2 family protein [Desulfomonile tiedjei]|nr:phosphatase PAP2 family protein [Desulfomonile tiedjei]
MPANQIGEGGVSFDVPLAAVVLLALLAVPTSIFDPTLFRLLNETHSPLTDPIWLSLTTLGDGLVLGLLAGAFLVKNPRITVLGVVLLVGGSAVVHVIKPLVHAPRPAAVMEAVHVVGPLLRSGSFPSGHAAAAVAFAVAVAHYSRSRTAAVGTIAFAVLVGLSRIFVGAHFPLDVLAGSICALLVFLLVRRFLLPSLERRIPDRPNFSSRRFRIALGFESLLALYTILVHGPRFAEFPLVAELAGAGVLLVVVYSWGARCFAAE